MRRRAVGWAATAHALASPRPLVALVAGADGAVDDADVEALLDAGHEVVLAVPEGVSAVAGPTGAAGQVPVVAVRAGSDAVAVARAVGGGRDVLVLRSGTRTGPLCLERLRWVAASVPDAATVSAWDPRADAAGVAWPTHLTFGEVARALVYRPDLWAVEVPEPYGPCTYVRTAAAGDSAWHALAPHAVAEGPDVGPALAPGRWQDRAAATIAQAARLDSVEPRILYIAQGVTRRACDENMALARELQGQRPLLLERLSNGTFELSEVAAGARRRLQTWRPAGALEGTVTDDPFEAFVTQVLAENGVEAVHVVHLLGQPVLGVARAATRLGLPLTMSVTDDYLVEPSRVRRLLPDVPATADPATEIRAEGWLDAVGELLDACRRVVTSTPWLRAAHVAAFGARAERIEILESLGPVAERLEREAPRQRRPGPLRVVSAARWGAGKGIGLTREVARSLGAEVEWHVLGEGSWQLADVAVAHPAYDHAELGALLDEIDADAGALLTDGPDMDGRVLTELWARGLRVVATRIGANADAVDARGAGALVPVGDVEASARAVLEQARLGASADVPQTPPAGGVVSGVTYGGGLSSLVRREAVDVPLIAVMALPGSTSATIRVARPAVHARQRGFAEFRGSDASDIVEALDRADYAAIVVQRTAVKDPVTAQRLASVLAERKIRLIVDLDDDLVSDAARARLAKMHVRFPNLSHERLDALAHLVGAADLVTVSMDNLRAVVDEVRGAPVAVTVANNLDDRLWSCTVDDLSQPYADVRLLYMGTVTHAADLELLVEPLALLNSGGRRVTLDVVGVSDGPLPSRHMARARVGNMLYPDFVRWMRGHAGQWAAGLAPLEHDALNSSKSDLKLLEYALAGLPAVATDYGPYAGRTDLATIVPNDPAAWAQAVEDVLGDPVATRERQRQVADRVRRERTWTPQRVGAWVDLLLGPTAGEVRDAEVSLGAESSRA